MADSIKLSPEQLEMSSKLTALQRKFAINLATPNIGQREAYLAAGGKAKTIPTQDACASEITRNPKFKEFYNSLLSQAATSAILTREQALAILTRNADQAEEHRDQHQAIKQLSAMEGWDAPKRTELTGKDGGPIPISRIDRKIV